MVKLDKPFKLDKNGLWYLNSADINLIPLNFDKSYGENVSFYKIEGIDNYIVKDTTLYPFFFNRVKNLNLLRKLQSKQDLLLDIDFPIGYVKGFKDGVKGTIIPYYKEATSLDYFIYLQKLNDLKRIYHQEEDDIDNLVALFLDILFLIKEMYCNEIYYVDIHSGNFLIYNNSIKIVDFEPGYIFFKDKNKVHLKRILLNYESLVNRICRRMKVQMKIVNPSEDFIEAEEIVQSLRKELKR